MMSPIRVTSRLRQEKLDPLSRINFGKIYTVEHNVKVFDFGDVHKDHIPTLRTQWKYVLKRNVKMEVEDDEDEDVAEGNLPAQTGPWATTTSAATRHGGHLAHQGIEEDDEEEDDDDEEEEEEEDDDDDDDDEEGGGPQYQTGTGYPPVAGGAGTGYPPVAGGTGAGYPPVVGGTGTGYPPQQGGTGTNYPPAPAPSSRSPSDRKGKNPATGSSSRTAGGSGRRPG